MQGVGTDGLEPAQGVTAVAALGGGNLLLLVQVAHIAAGSLDPAPRYCSNNARVQQSHEMQSERIHERIEEYATNVDWRLERVLYEWLRR